MLSDRIEAQIALGIHWRNCQNVESSDVPTVRLSGNVGGADDPLRSVRGELFCELFEAGWNLDNANGDEVITLCNIQAKINSSDAFVFIPLPNLQDLFSAASVFVGYQTLDPQLDGKPTVLLNTNGTWDHFIELLQHLREMGTVRQIAKDYLQLAATPKEVVSIIDPDSPWEMPETPHHADGEVPSGDIPEANEPRPDDHRYSVCVFCSASLRDKDMLDDGYQLGRDLADAKLGCVSGAGRTGIMGEVVRGAYEAGGWTGGSNVPHIIQLEGLPDGLSAFWPRPDIYTRMDIMIEESDAFVIMPGGCGTVQELLALLLRKKRGDKSMAGKPIVVFDREMGDKRFWTPLFDLIKEAGEGMEVAIAKTREEIIPLIEKERAKG